MGEPVPRKSEPWPLRTLTVGYRCHADLLPGCSERLGPEDILSKLECDIHWRTEFRVRVRTVQGFVHSVISSETTPQPGHAIYTVLIPVNSLTCYLDFSRPHGSLCAAARARSALPGPSQVSISKSSTQQAFRPGFTLLPVLHGYHCQPQFPITIKKFSTQTEILPSQPMSILK